MIKIKLPDGSVKEYESGVLVGDVTKDISMGLFRAAVGAVVNGEIKGFAEPIEEDSDFRVVKFEDKEGKEIFWHTSSHVMAAAIKEMYPETKFAIGPAIDDGFYYDMDLEHRFTPEDLEKIVNLVDSPSNTLCICTGSLGSRVENDVPAIIADFAKRGKIGAIHARNIKFTGEKQFYESAHLSKCGSLDMYAIMKALYDAGFDGYLRPDHGRMIWGEEGRAGYGLYDRALGVAYLNGLWEAIDKNNK